MNENNCNNNHNNSANNNVDNDDHANNSRVIVEKKDSHKPSTWRGHIKRIMRGSAYVLLRLVFFQFENVISVDTLEDWFVKYERVEHFCGPPIPKEKLDALQKKEERTQKYGSDHGRRLRSYVRVMRGKKPPKQILRNIERERGYASDSVLDSNDENQYSTHYYSDNEPYSQSNFHGAFPDPDSIEGHNFKEKRLPIDKDVKRLNHMIDDKNRPLIRRGNNSTVHFESLHQHKHNKKGKEVPTNDVDESINRILNHNNNCIPITHPSLPFHLPFLVIDARRVDEYIESHIHGSVNIPYLLGDDSKVVIDALPSHIDKKTTIITYCAVGLRSGLLQMRLRRMGFVDVRTLAGGYYKWVNEGRPIYVGGDLVSSVMPQHILAAILLENQYNSKKNGQLNTQEKEKRKSKEITTETQKQSRTQTYN